MDIIREFVAESLGNGKAVRVASKSSADKKSSKSSSVRHGTCKLAVTAAMQAASDSVPRIPAHKAGGTVLGRKQGGVWTAQPKHAAVIGPRAATGSEVDSQGAVRKVHLLQPPAIHPVVSYLLRVCLSE